MGFQEAEARDLPTLACIGRVTKVNEPKFTKVNENGINYIMIPVEVEGFGASRNTRVNFMFRPEWLDEKFSPRTLKDVEGGKGLLAVYGNNISQKGKISTLAGLAGTNKEAFATLSDALINLDQASETIAQDVADTLKKVLIDDGVGANIGYILTQQTEKTDEVDERGKPVYVKTQYYQVGEFFEPTQANRDKQYKRAERQTDGSFKVMFTEDDCPF